MKVETMDLVMVLCLLLMLITGCNEPNKAPVWGNGDPPEVWQENFGNGNLARLNFVQTNTMNQQGQALAELSKLNSEQHKIMGETDISLAERIKVLEGKYSPVMMDIPDEGYSDYGGFTTCAVFGCDADTCVLTRPYPYYPIILDIPEDGYGDLTE